MTTANQDPTLTPEQAVEKMKENGTHQDAINCTKSGDIGGLAFIINVANGLPGSNSLKLGHLRKVMDVLDPEGV